MIDRLLANQAVLAIAPIVMLGILMTAAGCFWIWKERRENKN